MSQSPEKKYRWYQFRLRFLVIVLPLGGLALAWPWAEIQKIDEHARLEKALVHLSEYQGKEEGLHDLLKQIIARRVSMQRLRVSLRSGRDRTVCLTLMVDKLEPSVYMLGYAEDGIVTGAMSFHEDWQTGQPLRIDPEIIRMRDFLIANKDKMKSLAERQIRILLKHHGLGPETMIQRPNVLRMILDDQYTLVITKGWSSLERLKADAPRDAVHWVIYPDNPWTAPVP